MSDQYVLAVDIGTSRTAAATARTGADGSAVVAPFPLGRRADSIPTVVYVAEDGELAFGDTAERRGITHPERLIREFKRHVGDDTPVVVGGRSLPPEQLYAQSLAAVVETVAEREGARPQAVSVTHPAAWGPHRLGLIVAALAPLGVRDPQLVPEPEAAARHYEASHPLDAGGTLAVYDLGGGTFDAIVLRKGADDDFAVVGEPVGIDDLGGADFDDAVFRHALATSGVDAAALEAGDADVRIALAQLRRECTDAKEALSFDADATIPVLLSSGRSSVRLTRAELEHMIDGALERTIDALADALLTADAEPESLEAILLIGGSSRIPLVAQRLSERFDRPLAVDADPKAAIALGAARTGMALVQGPVVAPASASAGTFDEVLSADGPRALVMVRVPRSGRPAHALRRRAPIIAGAAAVVVAGTLVTGAAAGASLLRAPVAADAVAAGVQAVARTGSDEAPPKRAKKEAGATSAPVAAPETPPEAQSDSESATPRSPRVPARSSQQQSTPSARPSPKAPAPQTPSAPASGTQTPGDPAPGGQSPDGTAPTTGPTTPPAQPEPSTPPADPEPSTPPAAPEPSTPPANPQPSTPPADPEPSTPPADPEPSTPPADPQPSTPPADPAPSPAPSETGAV